MHYLCHSPEGWGPISPTRPVDFTVCFQYGVVLPSISLVFIVLFVKQLLTKHRASLPPEAIHGSTYQAKMAFAAIACLASVYQLVVALGVYPIIGTYTIGLAMQTVVTILAIKTHGFEQAYNPIPSTLLLLFWLSASLISLMLLRTSLSFYAIQSTMVISIAVHVVASVGVLILEAQPKPDSLYRLIDDDEQMPVNPEEKANVFSRIFLHWLSPLLSKGLEKQITMDDIWELGHSFRPDVATEKFQNNWKSTLSLFKAVVYTYKSYWLLAFLLKLANILVSFLNPVLLSYLIGFVSKFNTAEAEPIENGYFYAICMFLVEMFSSIAFRQYWVQVQRFECLMKTTMNTAVYHKALALSNSSKQTHNVGTIINRMTVDAARTVYFTTSDSHQLWSIPLQIALCMYMLYTTLGWSVFVGLLIMMVSIPVDTCLSRLKTAKVKLLLEYRDQRAKVLEETLSGMRIIKLYAWESSFMDKINKIRVQLELKALRGFGNIQTISSFISHMVPFIITFATFGVYSTMDDMSHGLLNAQLVFVSLSLFNKLKNPIMMAPSIISGIMECQLSYGRLHDLLSADEIDFTAIDHMPYNRASPSTSNNDILVKVEHGSFKWLSESAPLLTDINMQCKRNELVAVIGKVGSGKSSLISAILGDMVKETGKVCIQGRIAYVPQVPWIINATLRDNILFGSEMDQELYDRVIDACALRTDLHMLPAGDLTEIGEKGINLSGGQKARVSLARAVYSRADVYLMDDPLAAVDAHVGKHIFSHVLGPHGLLQSRARILATNATQYLKYTDNILMIQDGHIIEQSTYATAIAQNASGFIYNFIDHDDNSEISSLDSSSSKSLERISERRQTIGIAASDAISTALAQGQRCTYQSVAEGAENGQTVAAEVNAKGKVSWKTYQSYLKSCGLQNTLLLLAAIVVSTVTNVAANYWLKQWASSNSKDTQFLNPHSAFYYLAIYGLLGVLGSATSAVRNLLLWARCSIESATTIHQNMLSGVMRSPMAYFDVTPVGRILNRFSSDLAHCDIALPYNVIQMVMTVVGISSAVFVISLSAPLVIVFLLLLSVFYLDLQHRYMFTSRETKRLESSTRSPIIAHLQESINGVSTIRAYGQQSRFIFKHEHKIEKHMRACYYNESLGQWLSIRLEAIGSIIMLGTTLSSVATLHYYGIGDPGMVGLAVTYALSLTGHLNMSVKSYTGMENSMVQLERINEFANLPSEAPETLSNRPAEEWPDQGTVEFKNYSTRYREGLDLAIKDLSFKVKPMQKVGIVGRTGAGKSSLTLALFRLIEAAAGQILIDGQDIAQYGLFDVRSKLSIIPQDPVLFAGTVRENLDPFGKYSDQEIWNALEHASLADFIRTKDERLEFQVSSGGENFSVGQRQLICLARALLKQAKILVLDEATAAIDNQTDAIIQKSIRSEFKQCTVLTIAHRINTIIDSDMILVLDGGRLAEYDTPEHLLQNKDGLFAKLVEESKK